MSDETPKREGVRHVVDSVKVRTAGVLTVSVVTTLVLAPEASAKLATNHNEVMAAGTIE